MNEVRWYVKQRRVYTTYHRYVLGALWSYFTRRDLDGITRAKIVICK